MLNHAQYICLLIYLCGSFTTTLYQLLMLHCVEKDEGIVWPYGCFCFSETVKRDEQMTLMLTEHLPCASKQMTCKVKL